MSLISHLTEDLDYFKSSQTVTIQVIENQDSFSNKVWQELHELSTNTFVEENERLKSNAAGAGLVDND